MTNGWTLLYKTLETLRDILQDDRTEPASKVRFSEAVLENYERELKEVANDPRD